MDTLLTNGDWNLDLCGRPSVITGHEEEWQRCRIRLQVPKGAFLHQPELGSGLHALAECPGPDCAARAMELAQESLLPMPHIRVRAVECQWDADNRLAGFLIRLSSKEEEREVLIQTDG